MEKKGGRERWRRQQLHRKATRRGRVGEREARANRLAIVYFSGNYILSWKESEPFSLRIYFCRECVEWNVRPSAVLKKGWILLRFLGSSPVIRGEGRGVIFRDIGTGLRFSSFFLSCFVRLLREAYVIIGGKHWSRKSLAKCLSGNDLEGEYNWED